MYCRCNYKIKPYNHTFNYSGGIIMAEMASVLEPHKSVLKERRGKGWEKAIYKLRSHFLWLFFAIIIIGAIFNYMSIIQRPVISDTKISDEYGRVKEVYKRIIFSNWHHVFSIASVIFYTTGISVFITVFVSNKIESYERRKFEIKVAELQNSIAKSAFESVYNMLMPDELFKCIQDEIMHKKVVRKNAYWDYRFEITNDNKIICERKFSYQLENIGRSKTENPVEMSFTHDDDSVSKLIYAISKHRDRTISTYNVDKPEDHFGLDIRKEANRTTVKFKGDIHPGTENCLFVSNIIRKEYTSFIQEVFFTRLPTIDGTLLIQYPNTLTLNFIPSTSSEFKKHEDPPFHDKKIVIYQFQGGVLPKQGFAFMLNRKKTEESNIASLKTISKHFTHKLRNVFGTVLSASDDLLLSKELDAYVKNQVLEIYQSGERALKIMDDIESLEYKRTSGFEQINLSIVVHDLLVSNEFKLWKKNHPSLDLTSQFDPNTFNTRGDIETIKKTILLLFEYIYNRDHNEEKAIEISLKNTYVDQPFKCYHEVDIGEYVLFRITNSNLHIDKEELKKCFDPFPTDVHFNDATGLEMNIILNNMKIHSGCCSLRSDAKGTTFELYFPVYRHGVITTIPSVPLPTLMGRKEKILVVDDEMKELNRARDLLNALDYRSVLANSGAEAIDLFKTNNTFDLVILDMVMPNGLNGTDTYEKIISINPGQKALIVSGYPEEHIRDDIKKAKRFGAGRYLRKPYLFQEFGKALKEELHGPVET
jgi:CheY-like chemotaxis protein/nitrogen-specific signal transduction histidine kinase